MKLKLNTMENWSRKGIFKSVNEIESLIGMELVNVRQLPKNAKIKDLNIAWSLDRQWLKGLCTEIENRI